MKHSSSPPTPSDFSAPRITRRHALIGLAALLAQAGFWSNPLSAAIAAARDVYLTHAAHLAFVELLKPWLARVLVFDYLPQEVPG